MRTIVIIAAGGVGSRMNAGINKVLLTLDGKTVFRRSMEAFRGIADLFVIAARPADMDRIRHEAGEAQLSCPVRFVPGGDTRQQSVLNALRAAEPAADDIVMVHDAARCMVDQDTIGRVYRSCLQYGSGIPAVPVADTIKECSPEGWVKNTPDRSSLFRIQTPQAFRGADLLMASVLAEKDGFTATDDASVMEHAGFSVRITEGSSRNIKLTDREDYMEANTMLNQCSAGFRTGIGYDVHRLVPGRPLILCGVEIPWELGLLGHSDADVALHALMDAMLGAAAMGDIGQLFPDTDPALEGISSLKLLSITAGKMRDAGYRIVNADITISAQKPKLMPYLQHMRRNIADSAGCPLEAVSVKATTTEGLGFEGRMEGISAQAVCLIQKI